MGYKIQSKYYKHHKKYVNNVAEKSVSSLGLSTLKNVNQRNVNIRCEWCLIITTCQMKVKHVFFSSKCNGKIALLYSGDIDAHCT